MSRVEHRDQERVVHAAIEPLSWKRARSSGALWASAERSRAVIVIGSLCADRRGAGALHPDRMSQLRATLRLFGRYSVMKNALVGRARHDPNYSRETNALTEFGAGRITSNVACTRAPTNHPSMTVPFNTAFCV